MNWLILFIAGLMEVVWAAGLKYTDGFSKFWPSVVTIAAMTGSIVLLSHAMKTIPIGTAYAIWTGIGASGVAIFGMLMFGEPRNALRVGCILLIVVGIVGLKLFAGSPAE
jgi:quaternary ammonium compound-resistance protein SugE